MIAFSGGVYHFAPGHVSKSNFRLIIDGKIRGNHSGNSRRHGLKHGVIALIHSQTVTGSAIHRRYLELIVGCLLTTTSSVAVVTQGLPSYGETRYIVVIAFIH